MTKYTSENITNTTGINTNLEVSLSFEIDSGSETVFVDDKLITNFTVAEARAKSILLEGGYVTKRIAISTYHIDYINVGDLISVDAILYKVINLRDNIKDGKVKMYIVAERWDNA